MRNFEFPLFWNAEDNDIRSDHITSHNITSHHIVYRVSYHIVSCRIVSKHISLWCQHFLTNQSVLYLTPGYEVKLNFFLDIDECASGAHDCSPDATCNNIKGSYVCNCNPMYYGDGKLCESKIFFIVREMSLCELLGVRAVRGLKTQALSYNATENEDNWTLSKKKNKSFLLRFFFFILVLFRSILSWFF